MFKMHLWSCFLCIPLCICMYLFHFVFNFQCFQHFFSHPWNLQSVSTVASMRSEVGLAILCVFIWHLMISRRNVHVWRGDGDTKIKRSWPRPHPNLWFHFVCLLTDAWVAWIAALVVFWLFCLHCRLKLKLRARILNYQRWPQRLDETEPVCFHHDDQNETFIILSMIQQNITTIVVGRFWWIHVKNKNNNMWFP